MGIDGASDEWPHMGPSIRLRMRAENGGTRASLTQDAAGSNILTIHNGTMGCGPDPFPASEKPLGGINLKPWAAPIRNGCADDEGAAGSAGDSDAGDAGEQIGGCVEDCEEVNRGGVEDCEEDEGRSDSDVESDSCEDDIGLDSNSGQDDGEDQDGCNNEGCSAMDSVTEI